LSTVLDIAEAVRAELAAGSFDSAFTPALKTLPAWELRELHTLRVTVVPKAVEMTGSTRAACQVEVQIDIGIQRKIASDVETETAELLGLVEQIGDFLQKRPLAAMPNVGWIRTANEPVYDPAHLAEQRVFTSVLTVTYRVLK
jgi:hypothetical protein